MYKTMTLKSMPHGNCRVIFVSENSVLQRIELVSYYTTVAVIDLDETMPVLYTTYEWKVFYEGRRADKHPPMTSIKHIGKFTAEFTGENKYHELKKSDIIILSEEEINNVFRTISNYL